MSANDVPSSSWAPPKPGLFDEEYLRDWTFRVAAGLVFLSAFARAVGYGPLTDLTAWDIVALVIDVGVASLITFVLFGFAPAALRRRIRAARPTFRQKPSADLQDVAWGVLAGSSLGAVLGLLGGGT